MIVKSELLQGIKNNFDLNIYETKVWLALLSKGIATAGEIAQISNVPRSRTYDVLESLEKQGFAVIKIGKPVKYVAVKPSTVLEKMKLNLLDKAKERVERLSNLKGTEDYEQIELLHKNGIETIKMEDLSGAVKGRNNILIHLKDAIEKASKSVVLTTNAGAMKRKAKLLGPVFDKLKKKGVKIKIAVNGDAEEVKSISKELKIEIKRTDMDARFCVVDEKNITFMVTPSNHENDTGIWVTSDYFAKALSNMFHFAVK